MIYRKKRFNIIYTKDKKYIIKLYVYNWCIRLKGHYNTESEARDFAINEIDKFYKRG